MGFVVADVAVIPKGPEGLKWLSDRQHWVPNIDSNKTPHTQ